MTTELYPLKFNPILKTVVWGGERIASFKGIATDQENVGESWELSAVEGSPSVVAEGPLAGKSLPDLVKEYGPALVGRKVFDRFGNMFPILVKFIDAREDLSIQVHPDDKAAARRHPGKMGKTEMWYIVEAEEGATIISGLSRDLAPGEFRRRALDGTITEVLARHDVSPGDVFFIPAGRIHALCKGVFVAEIQQTSDITYRIFDYCRPGLDGKPRALHLEEAGEAIDHKVYPEYKTEYSRARDKEVKVVDCHLFATAVYDLENPLRKDIGQLDSFFILICIKGGGILRAGGGEETEISIRRGETVLVPSSASWMEIVPADEGVTCLGCYIA